MKYVVTRIVEAFSAEEALAKARKMPVTEVYIHTQAWEKDGYELKEVKEGKLGFKDAKEAKN